MRRGLGTAACLRWYMTQGPRGWLRTKKPLRDEQVWHPASPGNYSIACRKGEPGERQKWKVDAKSDRRRCEGKAPDHPSAMGDYVTRANRYITCRREADPETPKRQETR